MSMPKHRRYSSTAQILHWLIALLIVIQFILARMAAHLPLGVRKLALLAEHKSFGMTVFILTLRGVTKDVPITFQFVPSHGSA
jgi:cytochrome b561